MLPLENASVYPLCDVRVFELLCTHEMPLDAGMLHVAFANVEPTNTRTITRIPVKLILDARETPIRLLAASRSCLVIKAENKPRHVISASRIRMQNSFLGS
jgi:hypothetical protein